MLAFRNSLQNNDSPLRKLNMKFALMSKQGIEKTEKRKTRYIITKFDHSFLQQSVNLLSYGAKVNKVCKKGKFSHGCVFYILEDDPSFLQWISSKKSYIKSRIDLSTVSSISDKPSWKLPGKLNKEPNILCINYGDSEGDNHDLVMKFNDPESKRLFWQGVQYFVMKFGVSGADKDTNEYLAAKLFVQADVDGSKALDYKETKKLLKTLHIEINKSYLKKLFEKYDKDKSNSIEMKEFIQIIQDITRKPEAVSIFKKYCVAANTIDDEDAEIMTIKELECFFTQVQKEEFSLKLFTSKYDTLHNNSQRRENQLEVISFRSFVTLLFSISENSIVDTAKTKIYQDMDRPLSDYYINSSHNTYLLSNQFTGESSTKAYINAFKKGCRCIEIDCWDGDKGEPITYHGFTLTSKILFRDVIKTVKEYGFSLSEFPIIISLENHCSQKQQERMSQIVKDELGPMLYILPENHSDFDYFPSPLDLKRRILMKGKGLLISNESNGSRQGSQAFNSNNNIFQHSENIIDHTLEQQDHARFLLGTNREDETISKSENEFAQIIKLANEEEIDHVVLKNTLIEKLEKNSNPVNYKTLGSVRIKNTVARDNTLSPNNTLNFSNKINIVPLNENKVLSIDEFPMSNENFATPKKEVFLESRTPSTSLKNINSFPNEYHNSAKEVTRQGPGSQLVISQFNLLMNDEVLSDEDYSPKRGDHILKHKEKVNIHLKNCFSLFGIKLNFDQKRSIWNISSISERKISRLFKEKEIDIMNFHKTFLTRIYPAGKRIDSSNFDPMASFMAGSQMIALNVQTIDLHLLIYMARFLENGCERCGFILKPSFMLTNCEKPLYIKDFSKPLVELTVEVISGHQLRPENEKDVLDVVDPYVEVFVNGIPRDNEENKTFRSNVQKNNGFNPQFNLNSKFKLYCPELITLVFIVWDKDLIRDEKLGWFAIPFNIIREGYRVVPLLNSSLQKIQFSLLFCKIQITPI